jgi:hypothetical protein
MKKNFLTFTLTMLFSFATVAAFAQYDEEEKKTAAPTPKWVSDKGYWVIESNKNNPSTSVLFFYNNDNVLVYKEKVEGIVFNLKKRNTKMQLKKVLDQSVVAYEQRKHGAENEMWVVNVLKR